MTTEWEECAYCWGSGNDDSCPECRGNGWVDDEIEGGTMVCPNCEGDTICAFCDGEGGQDVEIEDDEDEEE